jgi:hypothetical protein
MAREEDEKVRALKAQIEQENGEIEKIWGSLEEWDNIYKALENPAYEIAGRSANDESNSAFFSNICQQWTNILRNLFPEQLSKIFHIHGFLYSLAIMLINMEELFKDKKDCESLEILCITAYGEGFCDFSNPQEMKEKGMKIMKSIRNYNLASAYLGDAEE